MKSLLLIGSIFISLSFGIGVGMYVTKKATELDVTNKLDSSYNAGIGQGIIDANTAALIHISEVSLSVPEVRQYYSTERVNHLTDSLKHSRDSILLILKENFKD